MRTPRLSVVDRTDAPADLNRLVRFVERRNLVSTRVCHHISNAVYQLGNLFPRIPRFLLNFPNVNLLVSPSGISLIWFWTRIIGNTVQGRHRLNSSKHNDHVAWALCTVKEFKSAVTCRMENKRLIGGEGFGGGGGLILHSCLVKSADRKENTAATSYACVAAYVLRPSTAHCSSRLYSNSHKAWWVRVVHTATQEIWELLVTCR
jgi:hypothetical protein